jgi:3-phosphoshikimate 1-carboxyvinyltransferase
MIDKVIVYKKNLNFPQKITEPIDLPSSKSISNRLLILKYIIGNNHIKIKNVSNADDSVLMQNALIKIEDYVSKANFASPLELNLQNAGTVYRFLTAYLITLNADFVLNCDDRMKLRPIKPLVDSLREVGAKIQYLENENYPPISINSTEIKKSHDFKIDISFSSQFASAILLIAPFFKQKFSLKLIGELYSESYIQMTLELMTNLAFKIAKEGNLIKIDNSNSVQKKEIEVEADWSSASFFYQFIACSKIGTTLFINNLQKDSIQGDKILIEIFENFGVKSDFKQKALKLTKYQNPDENISIDFSNSPDIAIPVICTAAKLGLIGNFSGLKNLIHKESNRIKALEINLARFNYDFRQTSDDEAVLINSCKVKKDEIIQNRKLEIDVFNDHRIFMSFAMMADENTEIVLKNADAYKKSFPEFLKELTKLGFDLKT